MTALLSSNWASTLSCCRMLKEKEEGEIWTDNLQEILEKDCLVRPDKLVMSTSNVQTAEQN